MRVPTRGFEPPPRIANSSAGILMTMGAILLVGAAIVFMAWGTGRSRLERPAGPPPTTVDAIARDAAAFFGKHVTVTGEVETVFDARAFTLDEEVLGAGRDLLVLRSTPASPDAVLEDTDVVVVGTVLRFDRAALAPEHAWIADPERAPAAFADAEGRPVLVADSVERRVD
jgi:hypothetical protein